MALALVLRLALVHLLLLGSLRYIGIVECTPAFSGRLSDRLTPSHSQLARLPEDVGICANMSRGRRWIRLPEEAVPDFALLLPATTPCHLTMVKHCELWAGFTGIAYDVRQRVPNRVAVRS